MQDVVELLGRNPFFAVLAPAHHAQIAPHFKRMEVAAGTDVVRQGEAGDSLYLVASGVIGIFVRDPRLGIVQHLSQIEAPDAFGEMALVDGSPRSATCTALEPSVVYRLGRDVFLAVANQVPAVALAIAKRLSERLDQMNAEREVAWVSLAGRPFDARLWAVAPEPLLRSGRMIPLEMNGRTLTIGMVDPQDVASLDQLKRVLPGFRFKIAAVSADDWQRHVDAGSGRRSIAPPSRAERVAVSFLEEDETRRQSGAAGGIGGQVVAAVDEIVGSGLALGASDIPVEQDRRGVLVRYRVDGALQQRAAGFFPVEMGKGIVSRLKLLARLDITETRKPQDGRISARVGQRMVDLRLSTMPAKLGEKCVMRVLDAEASVTDLKALFHVEKVRQLFSQMIFRPQGLVMITGPTGSGKTTTLYSALHARRRPELNIVTVEDPIEYHLDGITQIQVAGDQGATFATILRSLLRQDPDVIMVGEMRDHEAARVAVEASMTGHLVLTSVHTNGALDAVMRLSDLGVERYAIANGLVGVLHQRLVKRICQGCSEPFEYPEPILEMLYKVGALLPNEKPVLKRGKGCATCQGTGFKGRVAIYEMLVADDAVRDAITSGADLAALRKVASKGAMLELSRYAGIAVGTGLTVPGEILHLLQRVGG